MNNAINTTNATVNRKLIAAIRIAYRVVWTWCYDEVVDHVQFISRSWKNGDRDALFIALGGVQFALSDRAGAYDDWAALRNAIAAAQVEQYPAAVQVAT